MVVVEEDELDGKVLELSTELIMHSYYCKEKSVTCLFCGILGYNVGSTYQAMEMSVDLHVNLCGAPILHQDIHVGEGIASKNTRSVPRYVQGGSADDVQRYTR